MKLIEKLRDCPDEQGWTNPNYSRAEKLEKIAEDFSVEFAYFIENHKTNNRVHKSIEQLLQIFKKEKGL